jgi:hypothetical protein
MQSWILQLFQQEGWLASMLPLSSRSLSHAVSSVVGLASVLPFSVIL